jgi:hypothetical protein
MEVVEKYTNRSLQEIRGLLVKYKTIHSDAEARDIIAFLTNETKYNAFAGTIAVFLYDHDKQSINDYAPNSHIIHEFLMHQFMDVTRRTVREYLGVSGPERDLTLDEEQAASKIKGELCKKKQDNKMVIDDVISDLRRFDQTIEIDGLSVDSIVTELMTYRNLTNESRMFEKTAIPLARLFKNNRLIGTVEKAFRQWSLTGHQDKGGDPAIFTNVNNIVTLLKEISEFVAQRVTHLSLEAPHDSIPGHGEHPAELGIGEVVVNVLQGQAEVNPTLEAEAYEAHGFGGHANSPELPVGQAHGLEVLAGGLEPNNVGEVAVKVVDGVGGPLRELDSVAGLAASVQDPQPDVGLELPELLSRHLPLEQPVEVDGLVLLNVPPAERGLELGPPAVDACALSGTQAYEHVDAAGFPLYLESRAIQQDLTVMDPFQLRFDALGIHP